MTAFYPRLSALALVVGLLTGQVGLCAGWMPSAEARMECCEDGSCPMHKHELPTETSGTSITQQDADACCASATTQDSSSAPLSAPVVSIAVLGDSVVIPPAIPALVLKTDWRVLVPVPLDSPPTYVLFSTFLI